MMVRLRWLALLALAMALVAAGCGLGAEASGVYDAAALAAAGGVDPALEDTCASYKTCDACVNASSLCHFCESDFECHAILSPHGCSVGISKCHKLSGAVRWGAMGWTELTDWLTGRMRAADASVRGLRTAALGRYRGAMPGRDAHVLRLRHFGHLHGLLPPTPAAFAGGDYCFDHS